MARAFKKKTMILVSSQLLRKKFSRAKIFEFWLDTIVQTFRVLKKNFLCAKIYYGQKIYPQYRKLKRVGNKKKRKRRVLSLRKLLIYNASSMFFYCIYRTAYERTQLELIFQLFLITIIFSDSFSREERLDYYFQYYKYKIRPKQQIDQRNLDKLRPTEQVSITG